MSVPKRAAFSDHSTFAQEKKRNKKKIRYAHTYINLFRHGKNISYKIEILKKSDLHACRVGARGGQLAIYLISKVNKLDRKALTSDGRLFHKCARDRSKNYVSKNRCGA